METILITGNTGLFTEKALEKAAEYYKVVIAGRDVCQIRHKNIRAYTIEPADDKISRLFDAYSFCAVWYLTGYVDGGEGSHDEAKLLEKAMRECGRTRVDRFILLSTVDSRNYQKNPEAEGGKDYSIVRAFLAAQTEETVRFFAQKTGQKVTTLLLPYLAGPGGREGFLINLFRQMKNGKELDFLYGEEDPIDFLSWSDLVELLIRVTDSTEEESRTYLIGSGYRHTYGELAEILSAAAPQSRVVYEGNPRICEEEEASASAREDFGFLPMDSELEEVGEYYRAFLKEDGAGKRFLGRLSQALGKTFTAALKYVEILLFFLVVELISNFTSNSVYFQYVDVRLFFVMIVASVWGMRCGIVAAVLECLALVREYSLIGVSAVQLFYVIENWIPFAIYIVTGMLTGYIRDKKTKDIEFANKEYELLRSKYIFLNDVHQNSLQNKSEYKRQILGFKDSFGKIFDAVQKLEGERPEDIFVDGLSVLEDVLQNNSIAIYSVEAGQRFGRLIICSGAMTEALAKSIRLEECQDMFETVTEGGTWRNTELTEGLPMYAGGVFRDGQIVLLITVQEAKTGQLGMDYVNIFHILCGLVQNSFLKALIYEELQEEENYISGTRVLRPKRLKEFLKVQEEMKRAGTADYVLLRLAEKDVDVAQKNLSGIVRTSDRIGAGEDGSLYLVLVQANRQSVGVVEERLMNRGLSYEIVEKVG